MENSFIINPPFEEVCPTVNEIAAIMGYKPDSVPAFVPPLLDLLLTEAPVNTSAAGCYRILKLKGEGISSNKVYFSEGIISCGSKICHQLRGAESVAIFVATAGNSFDEWIKRKGCEEDIMAEYLAGSIGSVIADKAADIVQKEISEKAALKGNGISNRYSPGYCSWNIREQQILFDLLPVGQIGVSLTGSFLMKPVKSVSGIIGIGPGMQPGTYICDLCDLKDCMVKRARDL